MGRRARGHCFELHDLTDPPRSNHISNSHDKHAASNADTDRHEVDAAAVSAGIPFRLIGGLVVAAVVGWYLFVFDDAGDNNVLDGLSVLGEGIVDLPRSVFSASSYQNFYDYVVDVEGMDNVARNMVDHMQLVATSMGFAIVAGVALGIVSHRVPALRGVIVGFSSILLTVPSLALFALLIPIGFFGIGDRPAIAALFLYALLPILRNTIVGLEEVDSAVSESAKGMGLGYWQRLRKIELPLAWPVMLTGIRIATLLNIGIAAIAILVGGSGLGVYVRNGLQRFPDQTSVELMWTGVFFTIVLALLVDALIAVLRKLTTSKGIS